MTTDTSMGLSDNDVSYEFSISKMHVVNESGNEAKRHYTIKLVEFMEYIARCAARKFDGPSNLAEKIE